MLGLHCSSGVSLVVTSRLLVAVTSLAQHRLQGTRASVAAVRGLNSLDSPAPEHRLSHCDARVSLLLGTWDLPGPGIEPVSPALVSGFSTTELPGKLLKHCFLNEASLGCRKPANPGVLAVSS